MPSHPRIPNHYAVVQLDDKHWYPLEVTRYYSGEYPAGTISLEFCYTFNEYRELVQVHFTRRDEAVAYVQRHATSQEQSQQERWQRITLESNVYPEQCAHLLTIIYEITGRVPVVQKWMHRVDVSLPAYECACGKTWSPPYYTSHEVTIEDALQQTAEYVYAHRCSCTATSVEEYEQLRAVA